MIVNCFVRRFAAIHHAFTKHRCLALIFNCFANTHTSIVQKLVRAVAVCGHFETYLLAGHVPRIFLIQISNIAPFHSLAFLLLCIPIGDVK